MDVKEIEDALRQAACDGDEEAMCNILEKGLVNVNSQHIINGWTALHWAGKRGHLRIASILLKHGADKTLINNKGDVPLNVTTNSSMRVLLGGEPLSEGISDKEEMPGSIMPNYIANPVFPYVTSQRQQPIMVESPVNLSVGQDPRQHPSPSPTQNANSSAYHLEEDELVVKARVANAAEMDFIEVELDKRILTFEYFMSVMCKELEVKRNLLLKVRKLPDTIIRKDKDVRRLRDFQEVELVLSNKAHCESSRNYGPSVSPKHIDVVY